MKEISCANIMENGFFKDIKFYLKAHHHVANPRALKKKKKQNLYLLNYILELMEFSNYGLL